MPCHLSSPPLFTFFCYLLTSPSFFTSLVHLLLLLLSPPFFTFLLSRYFDYASSNFGFQNLANSDIIPRMPYTGAWFSVVFVRNGTTGTYYLNGIQANTISALVSSLYTNMPKSIKHG